MAGYWDNTIIHWHLNWDKNKTLFQNYEASLEDFLNYINKQNLTKKFNLLVGNIYGTRGTATKEILQAAKYFNNKNGQFSRQMQNLINRIDFSIKGMGRLTEPKNSLKREKEAEKKLKDYKNQINEAFEKIYTFFGSNFSNLDGFFKYYGTKDKTILTDLKELGFIGSDITQIDSKQIQDLDVKAKGSLRSLAEIKSGTSGKSYSEVFNSLATLTATLSGYAYEVAVAHAKGVLEKSLVSTLGPNARLEYSGQQSSDYKQSTTDFQLFVDGSSQLQIKDLPLGISLKYSGSQNPKRIEIHIKKSNFGKMMDITMAQLGKPNKNQFEALSNILLSTHRKKQNKKNKTVGSQGENSYSYGGNWRYLMNQLNRLLVITGLAGSLTKEDLSLILIINDKVFNIYDLIGEALTPNNYKDIVIGGGITKSNIIETEKEHHAWEGKEGVNSLEHQKKRSKNILNEMQKIGIDMRLWLSLSLMKKLAK